MICFRCQQNFPPGRLVSARHVFQYWGTFTRTFLTMFEARLHVSMTSQLVSSWKQSACTLHGGVSWLTLLYTLHSTKISDAGIKAMNCQLQQTCFSFFCTGKHLEGPEKAVGLVRKLGSILPCPRGQCERMVYSDLCGL